MMKKTHNISIILLIIFLIFNLTITAFAHSGRTDSSGGHYDSSTGSYHYHHGYPAHQHTNGECPYDFDDKTSSATDLNNEKVKKPKIFLIITIVVIIIELFVFAIYAVKEELSFSEYVNSILIAYMFYLIILFIPTIIIGLIVSKFFNIDDNIGIILVVPIYAPIIHLPIKYTIKHFSKKNK